MATSQVMEIKAKNVECLKILISVAQSDGNYLGEAWYDVSQSIELARSMNVESLFLDLEMYQPAGISTIVWCQCEQIEIESIEPPSSLPASTDEQCVQHVQSTV